MVVKNKSKMAAGEAAGVEGQERGIWRTPRVNLGAKYSMMHRIFMYLMGGYKLTTAVK